MDPYPFHSLLGAALEPQPNGRQLRQQHQNKQTDEEDHHYDHDKNDQELSSNGKVRTRSLTASSPISMQRSTSGQASRTHRQRHKDMEQFVKCNDRGCPSVSTILLLAPVAKPAVVPVAHAGQFPRNETNTPCTGDREQMSRKKNEISTSSSSTENDDKPIEGISGLGCCNQLDEMDDQQAKHSPTEASQFTSFQVWTSSIDCNAPFECEEFFGLAGATDTPPICSDVAPSTPIIIANSDNQDVESRGFYDHHSWLGGRAHDQVFRLIGHEGRSISNEKKKRHQRHLHWFGHGKVWTVLGLFLGWMGTIFSILSRHSTEFAHFKVPLDLGPMYKSVPSIGIISMELCFNETATNATDCRIIDISPNDMHDHVFQASQLLLSLGTVFGCFFSIVISSAILWRSIDLRPVGLGYLFVYFCQSSSMVFFDTDICAEHRCRLGPGAVYSILACCLFIGACITTAKMDAFKLRSDRLRNRRDRHRMKAARQKKLERKASSAYTTNTSSTSSHSSDKIIVPESLVSDQAESLYEC